MSNGNWTPGPWEVFEYADGSGLEIGPPYTEAFLKGNVCSIGAVNGQHRANAHLIAAAPDLYDALSRIIEEYSDLYIYKGSVSPYEQARAAIAKATGDSQ